VNHVVIVILASLRLADVLVFRFDLRGHVTIPFHERRRTQFRNTVMTIKKPTWQNTYKCFATPVYSLTSPQDTAWLLFI
jgi:hypothetical protein